ncbi:hypothetical protein Lfu02_10290 [Longispora fulva]|uniref:Acyl carrier protein n=1 Tax=Longispora fulva TaxID=619741 RepID=A0A8J7G7G7_9ACTN|nr:phosphopantetheine-binding protein [Longispora fulva]MBG6135108.1 acyl carrier protein [Longispora fulva]GIG56657.1 hypothetical protein Lfu02_10290 [Longispora fulva]
MTTSTRDEISDEIARIIKELMPELEGEEITPESTFEDLGMDSLNRVDLLSGAESAFDIEVLDEQVANLVRVRDLTDLVAASRGV